MQKRNFPGKLIEETYMYKIVSSDCVGDLRQKWHSWKLLKLKNQVKSARLNNVIAMESNFH